MDIWDKKKRSEVMANVRSKNTKPEMKLRKALFARGYRYRVNDKRYPGKPDIVLPKYKTVIFVNGCFWHGHEECGGHRIPKSNTEFWANKIRKNRTRDRVVKEQLHLAGWRVITVWECELRKDRFAQTEAKVIQFLEDNSPKIITVYEEVDDMITKLIQFFV